MKQKLSKIVETGILGASLFLAMPQYSHSEPIEVDKNDVGKVEKEIEDKPFPVGLIFLGYGIGAGIAGALGYYSSINLRRD